MTTKCCHRFLWFKQAHMVIIFSYGRFWFTQAKTRGLLCFEQHFDPGALGVPVVVRSIGPTVEYPARAKAKEVYDAILTDLAFAEGNFYFIRNLAESVRFFSYIMLELIIITVSLPASPPLSSSAILLSDLS